MISRNDVKSKSKTIDFEIINHVGVLSDGRNAKGWQKELNVVSWNGKEPKFDIREWDENHENMHRGITLSFDELERLKNIIDQEVEF